MAQTRPCDVSPQSEQDKYSIALMKQSGEWIGLDVPLYQIFPSTNNAPVPVERVNFLSYHLGRGFDKHVEKQYGFYDSRNGWSTTPGKFHATLQFRWAKGLRNADTNMPNNNDVVWKKLTGNQRYLAATFVASATYTATKIIVLIRKNVPAGTVGAPSDFNAAIYTDNLGDPNTLVSGTSVTANSLDVTSEYCVFTINASLTSGTTYHVVVWSSSTDKPNACWEVACDPILAGSRSTTGSGWSNTTYSPYYRVTDANPARQYKTVNFAECFYLITVSDDGATNSKLYLNGTRGRATGTQTSTTLKDTSHGAYGATALPTNRFSFAYIRIIRGTGRGQVRQIALNSGDTFTVLPAWDITPVDGSSEYVVYGTDWFVEIASTGLGVVTDKPVIQNGLVFFPQGDGTAIRKMGIDYTDTDVHVFASETTNKAYFLEVGYDTSKNEPNIWRANNNTASVSRASTAPGGVVLTISQDLTFGAPILAGDNTNLITNIQDHEGVLHAFKENGLYAIQNDRAVRVRMGVETAPDVDNGRASVIAGDKNLYVSFRNDVYLVSDGGAYPTNLKFNLPSVRSGVVYSLIAAEGWLFAAINGGSVNTSSVMKFSLDTKSWSEQLRSYFPGYRIRNMQWQNCPETRNRLWIDIEGDLVYQEFPLSGVRPYDDKSIKYQHEAGLELPTIDLGTTDPKHFAVLTVTTQGLATDADTEKGSMIVVEVQSDNDIGTDNWEHVDYIKTSPTASVTIGRGNKRMLRPRLRLISQQTKDPVILEAASVSLFARRKLSHDWSVQFPITPDDDEQNSVDTLMWLRDVYNNTEPLKMLSRFTLYHDRLVTLADEPKYQLSELDAINSELEAQVWMKLVEVT